MNEVAVEANSEEFKRSSALLLIQQFLSVRAVEAFILGISVRHIVHLHDVAAPRRQESNGRTVPAVPGFKVDTTYKRSENTSVHLIATSYKLFANRRREPPAKATQASADREASSTRANTIGSDPVRAADPEAEARLREFF